MGDELNTSGYCQTAFMSWCFYFILYISVHKYPVTELPNTINALFNFLKQNVNTILITAINIVRQSVIVSLPIAKQTERIIATEATLTASRKAENSR